MSDPIYRRDLLRLAADAVGAGRLDTPQGSATVHNPACGDRVTVDISLEDGRITALKHHAQACVLTQASAAILGAEAIGLDRAGLGRLRDRVRAMLDGGPTPPSPFQAYSAFEGVAEHKGRHVCVLLPLDAALEALEMLEPAEPGA
ncbi:MAG TPA: iron-sulfur cluster assembly scaffold protein [Rhizomicrobium sp.]|jgi:NifU-like protein involved in Fe-S cluster formation|nr:iron-sulfur cluster assembly scaffold protein [Rhizomicrobium sp.]